MKMNIYFKGLVVSLLLIAGMFTSCEDQPDKFELTGGLPQVSYIPVSYTHLGGWHPWYSRYYGAIFL